MPSQEEPEQKIPNNAVLPTIDESTTSTKASWFDPSLNAMVRSSSTSPGQVVVASMEPGKDGFCMATFPGEKPFVTEVANVLLKKSSTAEQTGKEKGTKRLGTSMKRPAAKRPAAALQEPAPDHAATATHEPQAEEELPVSCLKYFLLISIAVQTTSLVWAYSLAVLPSLLPFFSFHPSSFLLSQVLRYGIMVYPTGKCAIRRAYGPKTQVMQFGSSKYRKDDLKGIASECIIKFVSRALKEEDAQAWCQSEIQKKLLD